MLVSLTRRHGVLCRECPNVSKQYTVVQWPSLSCAIMIDPSLRLATARANELCLCYRPSVPNLTTSTLHNHCDPHLRCRGFAAQYCAKLGNPHSSATQLTPRLRQTRC